MQFENRYDAAKKLAARLEKYRKQPGVIFAVPRGGVPIGYYLASHFNFPLELLLTKKIGHPLNPELAIGAVSLESEVIDPRHDVPREYIDREIRRIRKTLRERYHVFMGDKEPADVTGKTVILIDDGIATGNTMMASIELLRNRNPGKIVVATPVAPPETAGRISEMVDDFVCLYTPEYFMGVGEFYNDFSQVTDEEVIELLNAARKISNVA